MLKDENNPLNGKDMQEMLRQGLNMAKNAGIKLTDKAKEIRKELEVNALFRRFLMIKFNRFIKAGLSEGEAYEVILKIVERELASIVREKTKEGR